MFETKTQFFLIFRPWLKEFAIFDRRIEFGMQKCPYGSRPEVWKRQIYLNYDKIIV